ncbi:uncharacterized protein RAG0_14159 [Rhynchosporium agropyri]|uniref:Uncharacterized protein n=1 Tax=Rhynchosporium agropyri TaxID=914238 RepID=A0A1E1LI08_9HELO|nr:uncharacterized protein RAG0_14159 [Rhynchosporium agropyri]
MFDFSLLQFRIMSDMGYQISLSHLLIGRAILEWKDSLKLQYTDLTGFAVLDPPLDRQSRISDPSFRSSSIIYILRPQI